MTSSDHKPEDVEILARDGFALKATLYPGGAKPRGAVVISSATAVPRRFYRHYAAALASAGLTAVTYDYRGIGDSRPASLRGFEARTRDWGLQDMAGVIDWVARTQGDGPLFMVGHSVGGQVAGLLDNGHAIDAMITLSAQSGHWRFQGGNQKLAVALHVYVTLPLLANVFGYMPWSWFGSALDLPKGAALEWSRWCRDRNYLLGDSSLPLERYTRFEAPVLAYSISDDDWGTSRSVDAMMSAYPNVEREHVNPTDHGLDALGHFGYFRPEAKSLWSKGFEWLDTQLPGKSAGSPPSSTS